MTNKLKSYEYLNPDLLTMVQLEVMNKTLWLLNHWMREAKFSSTVYSNIIYFCVVPHYLSFCNPQHCLTLFPIFIWVYFKFKATWRVSSTFMTVSLPARSPRFTLLRRDNMYRRSPICLALVYHSSVLLLFKHSFPYFWFFHVMLINFQQRDECLEWLPRYVCFNTPW